MGRVRPAAWSLAALLLATGSVHLVAPSGFESIVPRFLGSPPFWVAASGVAELGCAAAIALPASRRLGASAAAALFVIVFPANVQMALDSGSGHGLLHDPVIAWGRLPLQIPLILWAVFVARRTGGTRGSHRQSRRTRRPAPARADDVAAV